MNSSRRVAKNFFASILVKLIVPFTSFVIFILIARIMGVETVGKYTFLLTMFVVFQFLSSMGMKELLIREITKRKELSGNLYFSAVAIGLAGIVFWVPIMIGVTWMGDYPDDIIVSMTFLAIGLPFAVVSLINEASFMGLEKFEFIPLINIIEAVYLFVASIAVVLNGLGIIYLAGVMASGKLFSAVTGFLFLSRRIHFVRSVFDMDLIRSLARILPPFFFVYVSIILFYRIDVLQLSVLVPERDLGFYSTAYKLYLMGLILPDSFSQAFFPRLSALAGEGRIHEISLRSIRYVLVALTPVVLVFFIFGGTLITTLFGAVYMPSNSVLVILIWTILPYAANSILGYVLLAGGHQWACAKVASLALVANIVLNYVLIKSQGFQGAAIATLVALVVCLFLNIYYIMKHMFGVRIFRDFLYPCLPAAAGGLVLVLVPMGGVWGRLAGSFFTVAVVSFMLNLVGREDVVWLRQRFLPMSREMKGL